MIKKKIFPKTAIISQSNKNGLKEFANQIQNLGIDIFSTGGTASFLKKNNIKVKKGILIQETRDLYNSYIINRKYKLPFVTAKIAISKNKLIYCEGIKRITNQMSDKISHYLRFKNDAIMISSKTLNIDNPRLDCRLKGFENFSPKRIILDRNLDINRCTYVYKSINKNNTIIFHNSSKNSKIQLLKKKGANLIKVKLNNKKRFDLKIIKKKIFSLGVRNLLVEGGDKLTKYMLYYNLVDQFYLFKSPKILPKIRNHVIFTSSSILKDKYKIKSKITSNLAKDSITVYKR